MATTMLGVLLLLAGVSDTMAISITLKNSCPFTVWPGWVSNGGHDPVGLGGATLQPGETSDLLMPQAWGGRLWARTGCAFDPATGSGTCMTGDCGGSLFCNGRGGQTPVTLAELQLDGYGGNDFFDVSLVDGYNLPMNLSPLSPNCSASGCPYDINRDCPLQLQQLDPQSQAVVGCKSACAAFNTDVYCCTGAHDRVQTCPPTLYSVMFKQHCPQAYSYAYDDASSTFTCKTGSDYMLEFCPSDTVLPSILASPAPSFSDPPSPSLSLSAFNSQIPSPSLEEAFTSPIPSPSLEEDFDWF